MMKKQTVKGNIFKTEHKLTKEMETGLNIKVLLQKQLSKEEEKMKLARQRELDLEMVKKDFEDSYKNVLFPKY